MLYVYICLYTVFVCMYMVSVAVMVIHTSFDKTKVLDFSLTPNLITASRFKTK